MFKKTLIAAAGLTLLATAAHAQVTLYGNVDLSVARSELLSEDGKAVTAVESGIHTGSFFGLKGQEDLGGGLKGFFVLESDISADQGAVDGNFWGRTSELGLSGGFGTVKLGNSRSLGFLANAAYNPFPVTGLLNTSQTVNGYGNARNAVTYMSPDLSGFSVAAQYGASEQRGVSSSKAVSLNYAAGPLSAGFNYSTQETSVGAGLVGFLGFLGADAAEELIGDIDGLNPDAVDLDRWQLGASYDLGAAKLFGQYGQNKFKGDGGSVKARFYQLGVAAPVSAQGTVMASFSNHRSSDIDAKFRDFTVAYDHAISKRTSAYAAYKTVRVEFEGKDTLNTFAVGVKHAF